MHSRTPEQWVRCIGCDKAAKSRVKVLNCKFTANDSLNRQDTDLALYIYTRMRHGSFRVYDRGLRAWGER